MGFLIGLLTLVMVADCLVLVFLVLIQLPKKEAGAGLAFGGSATDALFGAGSGTVLTKITKYAATAFFLLALLLSVQLYVGLAYAPGEWYWTYGMLVLLALALLAVPAGRRLGLDQLLATRIQQAAKTSWSARLLSWLV